MPRSLWHVAEQTGRTVIMARCGQCGRSFRTLDDEQDMHACPSCGYDGHEVFVGCVDCGFDECRCHCCEVCGVEVSTESRYPGVLTDYCGPSCYFKDFEELS